MQCPKCKHNNREGAKFCEECGEKLQLKCPKCGAELRANAKFCDECGANLIAEIQTDSHKTNIPKLEDMHAQLQSLIPEALAQKYLSAEQMATGENRPITALFADISGFTPLSANKSSEAIFQLVQDCFKRLVSIVAKYEGSISGFRGDGLLALFGAPILHENDAERAILSAIDMRNAMQDYQLQVSIGINTAMMTVGEIQTQLHNEYTAYGMDINLAKRLQEHAEAGQILVGSGTYRLTRKAFDFEMIPNLSVKGFSQPVTAYSVKQVKVHPEKLRGIEGLRARMIGREHEFADAKESVDEWLSGHGQIVNIIGEAGIGKSRLVSELKAYISGKDDDLQYIEGRCVSIGQPISYWPFIDILKTYFNLSEGDDSSTIAGKVTESVTQLMPLSADETLSLLGQLLSIKYGNELDDRLKFATPEQIRHQTLMRLRDIFTTLARQKPLLLILEDLHWSDDLSLDLISLLMDELANTPLMLLCVYRPEKEHRVWQLSEQARRKCMDRFTEIMLKPLSSVESRQLIESLLEIENLPESIKKMIMEKSEGNPFFIEEVIRSLIEQGMIYHEDDRWKAREEIADIDVPDTIQSVILSRVDRLQAEAKYVLQCASVIGRLFKHRLLEHLTHQEQKLNRYISEFEERELVYEERTVPELEYAFKHALTQEATYQSILERKRREFHLQVAQGIEKLYQERLEEYYEELAEHYSKSDDVQKAIEYMLKVGEKAKRNYANDTAISYYQGVLDMLEKNNIENNDWKLEALKGLGEVYHRIDKIDEAEGSFKQAIEIAKEMKLNPRQIAKLYFWISDTIWWSARYDDIIDYANMGLEILGDDTECLESALNNTMLGTTYANIGKYNECLKHFNRNKAFIRKLDYTLELRVPYTHIICFENDPNSAWEWAKELEMRAERINDQAGVAAAWYRQGGIFQMKNDDNNAIIMYRKSIDKYQSIGDNKSTMEPYLALARTLFKLGNISEAEENAQIALKLTEQFGQKLFTSASYSLLVQLSICQCLWDEAINYMQKYLEITEKIAKNRLFAEWIKLSLGYVHMRKGDYEKALNIFHNFADKIFELQDEYGLFVFLEKLEHTYKKLDKYNDLLNFCFNLLEKLEYTYKKLGKYDDFLNFCKDYREKHAEAVKDLPLQQWYLEPAQISNELSSPVFNDDFNKDLDPSWTWVDIFNDCHYEITENGIEIHAANGRDLYWLNMSAPRFVREITGDFAVQVCVSPATKDKPQIGGLFIWKDDKNYICFERGESDPYGFWFLGYINGKGKMVGRGLLPEESEFTYMRLERNGSEISAYCSIDNENWLTCGKLSFPIDDPIQVGIYAIGMIDRTIYCREYREGTAMLFRNFKIWTKNVGKFGG